jgi:DNA-binding NarL/FixJ family response regulator
MTTVVVVDDEALIREGLVAIISAHAGLHIVGTAANGAEAIAKVNSMAPDVVLMDVRMPVIDGLEATRRITKSGARSKVLILTTVETDDVVFGALRAGASGFLLKSSPPEQLWQGITTIAAGEALVAPAVTRRLIERTIASGPTVAPAELALSNRQRDVVLGVAQGLSNREIAAALFLSEHTIKGYVSEILAHLGLHARTQLVIAAYESGLVQPGGTST